MTAELNAQRKGAAGYTRKYNHDLLQKMDEEYLRDEKKDVQAVKERLILEFGNEDIYDRDGKKIFDHTKYHPQKNQGFPDTVNPYLWQSRKNNEIAGVVRLAKDYYVVTGVDVALIGFIRTKHGWIIQDCGNYVESAEISLRLVEKALDENIKDHIVAIIISHTHPDHYAGIGAFVSEEETGNLDEGKIPVIAPGKYQQSLIDDNLYAGVAMSRRLQYQGGFYLPHDEKGTVGVGLNPSIVFNGTMSFIMPNVLIKEDSVLEIDGTKIEFILSPNTETRAHMCTYYPDSQVLYLGDNAMGTLHNTYTMRGARVRDANFWGELFYRLYVKYGNQAEAIYQGHGVPQVKQEKYPDHLKEYLLDQAAAYKYTNDQALLLANKGYTLNEIGHKVNVPETISRKWYIRPHYGDYRFNARGACQRYLGFYDGNPVNLLPLETQEIARKFVQYIGSEDKVMEKALEDFQKGEYQWVAMITDYLVFLNPGNIQARYLCADALEQLGYQAESGLWRNAYLNGAYELRNPEEVKKRTIRYMDNRDVMPYVEAELILDYLGINFDGAQAQEENLDFVFEITSDKKDETEYHKIRIYKGTVLHVKINASDIHEDDITVKLSVQELYQLAAGKYRSSENKVRTGEERQILDILDKYVTDTSAYSNFNIMEP